MSAWKLMARELHDKGGSVRYSTVMWRRAELDRLQALGLASCTGGKGHAKMFTLTPLGRDWCEGRAEAYGQRGGIKFQATWLASLPRKA